MRVKDILRTTGNVSYDRTSRKDVKGGGSFAEILNHTQEEIGTERINNLFKEIEDMSERLKNDLTLKNVLAYRNLIKNFLEEVIKRMMLFSKEEFIDRRGKHKVYSIVKKIDKELEELTEMVLKGEGDNIKILSKLGIIRGLLLDIYS